MFLERRHLTMLTMLRDTNSVSEAAKRLHLTQSALSHQLKRLEDYFGIVLFVRKTRPLRFTPAGLQLLSLADEVLPKIKITEQQLSQLAKGDQGRLHIVIECHNCFEWLMPTLEQYRQKWPKIEMDLSLGFSFEPFMALRRGDVDVVITSDPQNFRGVVFEPLFDYQMVLVLAKNHPLTEQEWIQPEDLKTETLLTYPVERERLDIFKHFLDPASVEPANVRTVELTLMNLQLIASGRGVAALPNWVLTDYIAQNSLVTRPLGKQGLSRTLYVALHAEQQDLAFMKDFIQMARQISSLQINNPHLHFPD